MKKFISNNWKKILVLIGGIFIVINSVNKIFAEKVLLSDYIKYGKDIETASSGVAKDVDTSIFTFGDMPFSSDIVTLGGTLIGLIVLVLIITGLADKAGAKKEKKK